jgi:hypothetical protein
MPYQTLGSILSFRRQRRTISISTERVGSLGESAPWAGLVDPLRLDHAGRLRGIARKAAAQLIVPFDQQH